MYGGLQSARRSSISRAKPVGVTLCAGRLPRRSAPGNDRHSRARARPLSNRPNFKFKIVNDRRAAAAVSPSQSARLPYSSYFFLLLYHIFLSKKIFSNRRLSPPTHRPARRYIFRPPRNKQSVHQSSSSPRRAKRSNSSSSRRAQTYSNGVVGRQRKR